MSQRLVCTLLLVVSVAATGCDGGGARDKLKRIKAFNELLKASLIELEEKSQKHQDWRLETFEPGEIDVQTGELVFNRSDGARVVCQVQIIGSYHTQERTWLWAWDSPAIDPSLQEHAKTIRTYGEKHQYKKLTDQLRDNISEEEAWALAALAVHLNQTQGAYRKPAGELDLFMTIDQIQSDR